MSISTFWSIELKISFSSLILSFALSVISLRGGATKGWRPLGLMLIIQSLSFSVDSQSSLLYFIISSIISLEFESKYFSKATKYESYEQTLKVLAEAKLTTDNFFDNVIVNDENSDIKKNRLELLQMFCKTYNNFIDFSKIEGT